MATKISLNAVFVLVVLLSIAQPGSAQIKPSGVADTSFSVLGSYRNEIKHYPDIRIADPTMPSSVNANRNVPYRQSLSGRNLLLDIYQRKQRLPKPAPAILMVHGGGWRSGDRTHNATLAKRLAEKGFITITADYSLSTEDLFPAAVYDLKAAIRWIRAHANDYNIDTARIAILGFSAGGELAAFIGATNGNKEFEGSGENMTRSSTVQAVIDIDGILAFIHPESGEGNDSKSISAATYWFGYPKSERADLWNDGSPITHVNKNTPPYLFVNSSVSRMHAGREDFIKKLNGFDIYSEVKTFPDAPHTFMFFDPWFEPTLKTIEDFMNRIFPAK
ncbi:alpha/beta hydrolase family protein [Dyadobacter psychrophilus]|uniref:Acetyl esterase/lipase n=1 Tax=Dyadobacter psychrophilus TaxID=651661 RepID=A0A1T5E8K8_9BACT|nr:alpha/beta hydrolase [Dyadobacter psychrophilus]SKB80314.1 Acetyl esterase/lipase [Dyadobacter psychrophilus]